MKKKKVLGIMSILLTVCLFLSAAPLGGFIELESKSWDLPEKLDSAVGEAAALLVSSAGSANAEILASSFASGTGTQSDPYCIATAEQLTNFAASVNDGNGYNDIYLKLTADISLNNTDNWTNWGKTDTFSSTVTAPSNSWQPIGSDYGWFYGHFDGNGYVISGLYCNITDDNAGLFGVIGGTVINVTLKKSYISGSNYVGGIVGCSYGSISDCRNEAVINGNYYIGGIAASSYGNINRCCNEAVINGNKYVGGIVGSSNGIINDCCNKAVITGNDYVGGIAGNCYSVLRNCYNTGAVNGYEDAGGIAGYNSEYITNSYNTAKVTGTSNIGGITGYNSGFIKYCSNTGTLTGSEDVGGIAGASYESIKSCYYLSTCLSGTPNSFGTSLTASQMKLEANYQGFDFTNIWEINSSNGYSYAQFMKNLNSSQGGNSAVWDGSIATGFASGSGTEENPYIIKTAEQLAFFAQSVNSGTDYEDSYIQLYNDIILNDNSVSNWIINASPWTPIGTPTNPFNGIFDGNACTISGIYTQAQNNAGFFGYIYDGALLNLNIGYSYINGLYRVGGAVGYNGGYVINCQFNGIVDGAEVCGGIIGDNSGNGMSLINQGTVNGYSNIGGVIGSNYGKAYSILNTGTVNGYYNVGGSIGYNDGCLISSANYGQVSGNSNIGGISGYNEGTLDDAVNLGEVNGTTYTGGILGVNNGTVHMSNNTGAINGGEYTGGLCGENTSLVVNCYNTGKVSGTNYTGGLVGGNYATLSCCYNIGILSGTDCGGIVGMGVGFVTDCYYLNSCIPNSGNGIGKALSSVYMGRKSSYPNFDFTNIWTFETTDGYKYPRFIISLDTSLGGDSAIWDGSISNSFASGNGTKEAPYTIETAEQLAYFEKTVYEGSSYDGQYIRLENDISLNDTGVKNWVINASQWNPIGSDNLPFCGNFDGNGHTVRGVYVFSLSNAGLFGTIENGTVENINIEKSYIQGSAYVGGVVGRNMFGEVNGCSSSAFTVGNDVVGGVVGYNDGSVSNSSNSGTVIGGWNVGGVVGYNTDNVSKSTNSGKILGDNHVGGIAGYNSSDIRIVSNTGAVSGSENTGGLVGYNSDMLFLSYNSGAVNGINHAGGLTGCNSRFISNCYNLGTVSGTGYVGGLTGSNNDITENCYNIGTVSNGNSNGGVAGNNIGLLKNCYYLNTCTADTANDLGTPLTSSELKKLSSYAGFDFNNVWTINSSTGYTYAQLIINLDKSFGTASAIWNGDIATDFASGDGTADNPYLIKTAKQLAFLAESVNNGNSYAGKYLRLENDIALNDGTVTNWILNATPWTPIGTALTPFSGNFDGNGHSVSGMYIDGVNSLGLFGSINDAVVRNTHVEAAFISGSRDIGAIAGKSFNGTIDNCSSHAVIFAVSEIGGIVGENYGIVSNCFNTGISCGGYYIGGIAGDNYDTVIGCFNTGFVNGYYQSGGIAGGNYDSITQVYNTGTITGYYNTSGIVGYNADTLNYCYNVGTIGGFSSFGAITDSFGAITDSFDTILYSYYLDSCAPNATYFFGTSLTESEMRDASGFNGFDFTNNWTMDGDESYPYPELLYIIPTTDALIISDENLTLDINNEYQLSATYSGDGEPAAALTWTSSDTGIATVSDSGLITAVAPGIATITVADETRMLTATCHLTVICSHTTTEIQTQGVTCTQDGIANTVCSVCGELLLSEPASMLGHDFSVLVSSSGNCQTQATLVYKCSRCEATKTTTTEAGEHQYTDKTVQPTCTQDGNQKHICSLCGFVQSEKSITKLGHDFSVMLGISSGNCKTKTRTNYRCSRCDETNTVEGSFGSHKYTSKVTPPTCTAQGYTTRTCSICSNQVKDTFVSANGHIGGTTEKVKAATNTEAGYKQIICNSCGMIISTQQLPKLASINPGDIDSDSSVSAADARLALRCSVGLEPNMTKAQLEAADVDGDGKITAADARLILRYSVGLETSFPK